ncbi:MAG TPA: DAK2 domain-containing protein [Acidimicrobiales bacterium]|nr:DAK2 domain-containing protein [Acidimicrobiales bacterium]
MTIASQLKAKDLRHFMNQFFAALVSHREALNMLNVYPVPDGDTGTNMSMTAESVVNALKEIPEEAEITEITSSIAHGSLMGARGNSGVILSQILRAFSSEIGDSGVLNAASASTGLSEAAKAAYGAVMTPVEGTILTVVREASEAAEEAYGEGGDLLVVIEAALERGKDALARTPEMLPVLAEAGVVDAGGSGFLLLLDALLNVVDGRPLPEAPDVSTSSSVTSSKPATAESLLEGPRYEVMYFLEADDDQITSFKEAWNELGDSIVVVGGDRTWNCHVHTDDVGAAIEAGIEIGRPYKIRVSDLLEEAEEQAWVREQIVNSQEDSVGPPVPCAVVAVANGVGIVDIFQSLGVQKVIVGGQSMNPSTEQLLEAVEAVPADEVVILPNNGNIIPVAEQVDEQTSKTVRVIRTKGITEGFASLLEYDPQGTANENLEGMTAAASQVVAGEITIAVRDSGSDAGDISEGDYLGLSGGKVQVITDSLFKATTQLISQLVEDHELVTLIAGAEVEDSTTEEIVSWVEEKHPMVEVETHFGGQPLYPYFLGIE